MRKRKTPWAALATTTILLCASALAGCGFARSALPFRGAAASVLSAEAPAEQASAPQAEGTAARQSAPASPLDAMLASPRTAAARQLFIPLPELALTRTETWAEKFASHFTDTVRVGENSYSSPNLSLTITRHTVGEAADGSLLTYYVADIYIAEIDCFRTYLAGGSAQEPMTLFAESGAVLAVSGDFESYQIEGTVIRNGALLRHVDSDADVCVLFQDGRIVCYDGGTVDITAVLADAPLQAWTFGPTLVENGQLADNLYTNTYWGAKEPRMVLGYFEPGHYCFVAADGRQYGYSNGASLKTMAEILTALGCQAGYNLDGGGSAFMAFDGQRVNSQSSNRRLGDLLVIAEPET